MFYRGIDQNGMCFFSQEDDPVQSEPSISQLSKPKESIETHIQDDGPVSNRKFLSPVRLSMFFKIDDQLLITQFIEIFISVTDAAYQIYYHLEHLLNIDYYDEENDYWYQAGYYLSKYWKEDRL